MRALLLFLAIASTAIAAPQKPAPKPAATPEPIGKISAANIEKTLVHILELNGQVIEELKKAQAVIVDGLNANLKTASAELAQAKGQAEEIQKVIDGQREQIAEDAKKIARYHRLLRIVCTILASVAAFLVFEMLKPTGLIGAAFTFAPWVRWVAPLIVFGAVFGAAWSYF